MKVIYPHLKELGLCGHVEEALGGKFSAKLGNVGAEDKLVEPLPPEPKRGSMWGKCGGEVEEK
jgi:hypothetical protein